MEEIRVHSENNRTVPSNWHTLWSKPVSSTSRTHKQ